MSQQQQPPVFPFRVFRGRVMDVERAYVPVMRGGGQWTIETRIVEAGCAIWVRDRFGMEERFTFDPGCMPDARRGHQVTVILLGTDSRLAAFANHAMGRVHCYRPEPPWRRKGWNRPGQAINAALDAEVDRLISLPWNQGSPAPNVMLDDDGEIPL